MYDGWGEGGYGEVREDWDDEEKDVKRVGWVNGKVGVVVEWVDVVLEDEEVYVGKDGSEEVGKG